MRIVGVDIGSRTIKVALVEDGRLVLTRKGATTYNPLTACLKLLEDLQYEAMAATGYGRHLIADALPCVTVSEIMAFAIGARALVPSCRTVLDIGGQDTKAISLKPDGKIARFEMNDKCAAGTGRFLEVMSASLGFAMDEFAVQALAAPEAEKVNAMCTVFAESEIISRIARGADRSALALGIHEAMISRALALLKRASVTADVVFAGGVAFNPCARRLIEKSLGISLVVPEDPQIIGALGCALYGSNRSNTNMQINKNREDQHAL